MGAVVFLAVGCYLFFYGFTRLRRKRLIENISTSTIRGLALGLVEIVGRADRKALVKSPLSQTDCVLYYYTVERHEQTGKSSRWVTIAKGDSFCCPFQVIDDTGSITVMPLGAEMIMPVDYEYVTGWLAPLPQNLINFMEKNGLSYRGIFGNYEIRFKEHYILSQEQVYVLGVAGKCNDYLDKQKEKLILRLSELKKDALFMKKIDVNNDGNVSQEEWGAAVSGVEQEVLQQELDQSAASDVPDIVISRSDTQKTFIISDRSQKELIQELGLRAGACIFGGAVLILAGALFLFYSLGIFKY